MTSKKDMLVDFQIEATWVLVTIHISDKKANSLAPTALGKLLPTVMHLEMFNIIYPY